MGNTATGSKIVRVRQQGGASILAIPLALARALTIKPGDYLAVAIVDNRLVAWKVELAPAIERIAAEIDAIEARGGADGE